MKKLMTTLAASLVATAIMADVTSQNVVGYSSLTFKQGYNLVGVQFEAVGGGTIDIQDIFTDITLMGYDEDAVPYDFMNVWGNLAGGYIGTFYWTGDFDDEADGEEIPPNVWVDASDELAAYEFSAGDAFWIYTYAGGSAAGAVTMGQVGDIDKPLTIRAAYNLVANPFPTPLVINSASMVVNGLTGYDEDAVPYDFMNVWDNVAGCYVGTFYWTGDFDDEADGEEIPPNVWVDAFDEVVENYSIAPNAGFWIYHYGTGATLTFSSPL